MSKETYTKEELKQIMLDILRGEDTVSHEELYTSDFWFAETGLCKVAEVLGIDDWADAVVNLRKTLPNV